MVVRAPRVHHKDPDFSCLSSGSLVAAVWHGETSLAAVGKMDRAICLQAAATQTNVSVLVVVQRLQPPSPETRAGITNMMKARKDIISCCGLVFQATGFGAAVVRGVVTGLLLVSNNPFPYRVFDSSSRALDWMYSTNTHRRGLPLLVEAKSLVETAELGGAARLGSAPLRNEVRAPSPPR